MLPQASGPRAKTALNVSFMPKHMRTCLSRFAVYCKSPMQTQLIHLVCSMTAATVISHLLLFPRLDMHMKQKHIHWTIMFKKNILKDVWMSAAVL